MILGYETTKSEDFLMMRKLFAAGAAAIALLGGGCIFGTNDYVANTEFDLALPKNVPGCSVRMGVFKNLSGSDQRFMMRRGDGQVSSLEYLRWRMSPELLLQRCVYGAFSVVEGDNGVPLLNATVYCFEFDEREKTAHLAADFDLLDFSGVCRTVRVDVAVPVKPAADPGAARAAAMSECARQAVEKLAGALKRK